MVRHFGTLVQRSVDQAPGAAHYSQSVHYNDCRRLIMIVLRYRRVFSILYWSANGFTISTSYGKVCRKCDVIFIIIMLLSRIRRHLYRVQCKRRKILEYNNIVWVDEPRHSPGERETTLKRLPANWRIVCRT